MLRQCSFCGAERLSLPSQRHTGTSLFSFPTDPTVRELWLRQTGLRERDVRRRPALCSRHFTEDDAVALRRAEERGLPLQSIFCIPAHPTLHIGPVEKKTVRGSTPVARSCVVTARPSQPYHGTITVYTARSVKDHSPSASSSAAMTARRPLSPPPFTPPPPRQPKCAFTLLARLSREHYQQEVAEPVEELRALRSENARFRVAQRELQSGAERLRREEADNQRLGRRVAELEVAIARKTLKASRRNLESHYELLRRQTNYKFLTEVLAAKLARKEGREVGTAPQGVAKEGGVGKAPEKSAAVESAARTRNTPREPQDLIAAPKA